MDVKTSQQLHDYSICLDLPQRVSAVSKPRRRRSEEGNLVLLQAVQHAWQNRQTNRDANRKTIYIYKLNKCILHIYIYACVCAIMSLRI